MENNYHAPVMLKECLEALNIQPSGRYVDVTFGGGGHSRAILNELDEQGTLIAFDQDEDAKANLPKDKRLVFIDQNFGYLYQHLHYQELIPVDGILADLGVSSHQFDEASRGFSFRFDEANLDMRMSDSNPRSASVVLMEDSEEVLANIFYNYGELRNSRALAAAIATFRKGNTIETVGDLKSAIRHYIPKYHDYKFLAQVFQALRIEVNQEMDVLKRMLEQSAQVLRPGGRLVVMSYHSLEDRLVKNFMASGNMEGRLEKDLYGRVTRPYEAVSRKVITPSEEELLQNPRSRSAKLRVAEKI